MTHLDRSARLRWIRLSDMRVSPIAQREKLDEARVQRLAREFDPDKFDAPKINLRDGTPWIVDGWHRTEAAKVALGLDQEVQCWVRIDLTDEEAAEWSLGLNDYRRWSALDTFRVALTAGREAERDIDRIVRANGCVVSSSDLPGAIGAVGTVRRIYTRGGPKVLARAIRICRDAYGDPGLYQYTLDGIGYLCQRYNGELEDSVAVERLGRAYGGVNALLGKAETIRRTTGKPKGQCVAAAAVEIINAGKGGKKLPGWGWEA